MNTSLSLADSQFCRIHRTSEFPELTPLPPQVKALLTHRNQVGLDIVAFLLPLSSFSFLRHRSLADLEWIESSSSERHLVVSPKQFLTIYYNP